MLPKGKFDGVDTVPMFELAKGDAGSFPPPPPPPFGRGERAYARVWCPLGQHPVRVINDGFHLRYATHWPTLANGHRTLCPASERDTAELPAPHRLTHSGWKSPRLSPAAVCTCGGEEDPCVTT